jgi:hypothetical protein
VIIVMRKWGLHMEMVKMKDRAGLMSLYKSITGSTIAHPPIQYNDISFEGRIIQEYSYIPDYLTGEI